MKDINQHLIAQTLKNKISNILFEKRQKQDAKIRLKNIELQKGKTNSKFIKLSDEYAQDVLGSKIYAYWLYVYCAMSGKFKEGWIPDNYFWKIVIPKTQGDYGKLSFQKATTFQLFNIAVFPDIIYFTNGIFYSTDYKVVTENTLKDFLFKSSEVVVFKKDVSMQGLGVFFFNKDSFDLKKIHKLGNGVFQNFINQHSFFSEFTPLSVATIRITTISDKSGIPSVRASFVRFGQQKDKHVNAVSDVIIAVNIKNGKLDNYGYVSHWQAIEKHPDTNIPFKNKIIPFFDKCIKTALELHRKIPYIGCVGWDMVVDENEVIKVMEWNAFHPDIKFSEATQGPCFTNLGWENYWKENN